MGFLLHNVSDVAAVRWGFRFSSEGRGEGFSLSMNNPQRAKAKLGDVMPHTDPASERRDLAHHVIIPEFRVFQTHIMRELRTEGFGQRPQPPVITIAPLTRPPDALSAHVGTHRWRGNN